jgi:glycerol-3-phosphate dehydrogenase
MWGYDLTGGIRIGKRHQRLTKSEVLERFPTFPPERLVSGYLYFDAGADDARLVTAILRTAALHFGAVIANYVDAKGFGVDTDGRIDAVHASADGADFTIRTRLAINAAGVWSDEVIRSDTGQDPEGIRPAKGIHIVVPHHLIGVTTAAVVPVPGDRRSVFVVPQGDFCYIGTTDTDYSGSLEDPQCEPEDIDYLLKAINQSCTNTITRDDICGTWAGLRPLVKSEAGGRTADLSRGHRITETDHGLITITGGKLTTYRHMAEDTVDLAVKRLGRSRNAARCATKRLHLRGAEGYHHASEHLVRMGLNPAQALHLSNRYGGEAIVLGEMTIKDPSLREPLVDGLPYLRVEALFAIRHEMARTVSDVMERRTRALLYFAAAARAGGSAIAAMLAEELGWDDATKAASLSAFEASADRQILAVHRPLKSVSA